MQKKKENKPVKQILLFIIILIIVLLILFSKNIINLINKNKINLAQNIENNPITNEPNIPQLSAGMIPVKWNGSNWVITTQNDGDWYNYAEGKPAYVMLNDGVYQSELIRDMGEKKLAEEHIGEPIGDSQLGTIFAWIPRFAYNENGETQYVMTEMQLDGKWTIPDMFIYSVENETKPDFSLTGVWLEKDVDTSYSSKLSTMQKENGIYGFLANTKTRRVTSNDTTAFQKYIEATTPLDELETPTNTNRIILQIINQKLAELIKAKIEYNKIEQRIEIRVTYTKNGIKQILDENGDNMELTENDGVIYTDTSNIGLATGTYNFTVIDNENNKKELSIDITVDSLFKVAYINGTDNMNIDTTYAKTQEKITSAESSLLNQIRATDTTKTFSRAISSSGDTTAIAQNERTSDDSPIYIYKRYKASTTTTYKWQQSSQKRSASAAKGLCKGGYSSFYYYGGTVCFTGSYTSFSSKKTLYTTTQDLTRWSAKEISGSYYKVVFDFEGTSYYFFNVYEIKRIATTTYKKGDYVTYIIAKDGTYTIGSSSAVHKDGYWYERNNLPRYTLYKYDENLTLKSTYDIETKVLTTVPINITNKGNNKLKLTLNTYGSNYKTYISNDNTNWQEVTGITSGTPKELNVDGWDKLYIKIETNTSRIDNIDVAYYKN